MARTGTTEGTSGGAEAGAESGLTLLQRQQVEWELSDDEDAPEFVTKSLIRRRLRELEQQLAAVRTEVASVRGKYSHPDQLEQAVFEAFDRIAKRVGE